MNREIMLITMMAFCFCKSLLAQWTLSGNNNPNGPLKCISITDKHITVVGSEGAFQTLNNGNYQWSTKSTLNFKSVSFVNGDTGWFLSATKVYVTYDGAQTITELYQDENQSFERIHFVSARVGWICGQYGTLLKTSDGGKTWSGVFAETYHHINNMAFVNNKITWIAGGWNALSRSINNGLSWLAYSESQSNDSIYYDIFFSDSQHGWVCGTKGVIKRTIDGGLSWQVVKSGNVNEALRSIRFRNNNEGYAVGIKQGGACVVYASYDGGASWVEENTVATLPCNDIQFDIKNNKIWVASEYGHIMYRDLSTGLNKINANYDLVKLGYNTTKDLITIDNMYFKMIRANFYSIDGRLLLSKNVESGISFIDVSKWNSGVYLVELKFSDEKLVKKINVQ